MKKYIVLFALALPLIGMAQDEHARAALSPKQRATLHAKELQLELDLNVDQTKKIEQAFAKHQSERPQKPKNNGTMTADERYAQRLNRIELQIAMKQEMKTILNNEQFAKWEKMHASKKGKGMHRGNGRMGMHHNKHKGKQEHLPKL